MAAPAVGGETGPGSRRGLLSGCALLLVLLAAAYAVSIRGEFVFDDRRILEDEGLPDVGAVLWPGLAEGYRDGARPLARLSFALNLATAGDDPLPFHATNVLLHAATAVAAGLLARRLLRRAGAPHPDGPSLLTAGLFALHPLQTQAVSYVSQRGEVLASLLYLVALLLLLEAEESPRGRSAALVLGALLAEVLGLGAKTVVVTLPAAYLLCSLAFPARARPGRPIGARARLAVAAALLVPALLHAAALARASEGREDIGFALPGLDAGAYAATQARVVLRYVALLAVPAGQNVDPDVRVSAGPTDPVAAVALVVLALGASAAAVLLVRWRRGGPAPRVAAVGLLWFLLLLSPTSSFVPLADVMQEHRVYLASWGLFLGGSVLAGAVLARCGARRAKPWNRAAAPAVVVLFALLAAATALRNRVWRSQEALWTDAVAKSPRKARPHANLGWALAAQGRHVEAVREYETALALGDRSLPPDETYANLGASFAAGGDWARAAAAFRAGLLRNPRNPDLLNDVAIVALEEGRLHEARSLVARALAAKPSHADARNTLGEVELREGHPDRAAGQFLEAIRLGPSVPSRRYNLAAALEAAGRTAEACAAWADYERAETDAVERAEGARRRSALGCPTP